MNITFLGQGYNNTLDNPVGSNLIELLNTTDFDSFIWFSAFASEMGIGGLQANIEEAKQHFKKLKIVVGIDQNGTPEPALRALLKLGVETYIFYQTSFPIFHPKVYLFEGKNKSTIIVGSSNLTVQGLFVNIEASIRIDFDLNIKEDLELLNNIRTYFNGIFEGTDPNLVALTPEIISDLVKAKIILLPEEIKKSKTIVENDEQHIDLSKIFPKRIIARIPDAFKRKISKSEDQTPIEDIDKGGNNAELGILVWRRHNLPPSSVQVSSAGTNPTGGLRLVQAKFVVNGKIIDQTTYFRNTLFGHFEWEIAKYIPLVEKTTIPFEITINGQYLGQFPLEVRHKPSGEAGQHNYTTSISWGELGSIIQNKNLSGAQIDIYTVPNEKQVFSIVISSRIQ